MFKGLGNLANIGNLMKQAQEMGGKMKELNEQLRQQKTSGAAGGGMIEVDVNGLAEVLAVRIDPSLFEKGDREMIEDLLPAAFNAANAKAKELHAQSMQSITQGMNMPGLEDALGDMMGGGEGPGSRD